MNSRYRERKYNTPDNDRLLRALSQPVQAWDKKWTQHSTTKNLQTFKWIKSDRVIEFEEDESDEEPEAMETDQPTETNESTSNPETTGAQTIETKEEVNNQTETKSQVIPGGQSSMLINKMVSFVQQEEDDDERSMTPKLDDISDVENGDNDEDNDVDSINDPSKHPALAPHAHARMTDDDLTDSTAATPQTTTEENTPMPMLEDEQMHEQHPHPLSQEIISGTSHFLNDNDSSAIQTPETMDE